MQNSRTFACFNQDPFNALYPNLQLIESTVAREECRALYHVARNLDVPGVIVEIGSYMGRSTCALGYGGANTKRKVYAVDHHQGDVMSGHVNNQLSGFYYNLGVNNMRGTVFPVVMDSLAAAHGWPPDRRVALLFIDGLHTEEQCMADFRAWQPHLAERAWVLFHDYADYNEYGVCEVVDALVIDGTLEQPGVVRTLAVTRLRKKDLHQKA